MRAAFIVLVGTAHPVWAYQLRPGGPYWKALVPVELHSYLGSSLVSETLWELVRTVRMVGRLLSVSAAPEPHHW